MKCERRKGQVEFVVIAGVILVIAVAIVLSLQTTTPVVSTIPLDIQQEQQSVQQFIKNVVTESVYDSLDVVEAHGGYLNPEYFEGGGTIVPHTAFLNDGVPYWQTCGDTDIPDKELIARMMNVATERHIRDELADFTSGSGKEVVFSLESLEADTAILEEKVIVRVSLPTAVEGYPIDSYPAIEIPTKLGRIYNFAQDFALESASTRFFEEFLLHSIYFSRELPTVGFLTECGGGFHLSGEEVDNALEQVVKSSIRPSLWTPMVDQGAGSGLEDYPKIYAIERVSGKQYPDLEIRFDLPDDFDIAGSSAIDMANNQPAASVPGFEIEGLSTEGLCMQFYNAPYEISYPVIISVYDDLTGNYFRVASLVHLGTQQATGIDAEAILQNATASFDQNLMESGFTRSDFESMLEAEGLSDDDIDDMLEDYDLEGFGSRGILGGGLETITQAAESQLIMGPGNCDIVNL